MSSRTAGLTGLARSGWYCFSRFSSISMLRGLSLQPPLGGAPNNCEKSLQSSLSSFFCAGVPFSLGITTSSGMSAPQSSTPSESSRSGSSASPGCDSMAASRPVDCKVGKPSTNGAGASIISHCKSKRNLRGIRLDTFRLLTSPVTCNDPCGTTVPPPITR